MHGRSEEGGRSAGQVRARAEGREGRGGKGREGREGWKRDSVLLSARFRINTNTDSTQGGRKEATMALVEEAHLRCIVHVNCASDFKIDSLLSRLRYRLVLVVAPRVQGQIYL